MYQMKGGAVADSKTKSKVIALHLETERVFAPCRPLASCCTTTKKRNRIRRLSLMS